MEASKHEKNMSFAVAGLAALGVLFLAYLTKLHFSTDGSALCNFGASFDCHIVNQSLYSEFLGVPISILGMGYFVAVGALALMKDVASRWRLILLMTLFSLVFSLYLSGVEVLLLGTVCLFCEASKALMLAIGCIAAWHARHRHQRPSKTELTVALGAGLLMSLAAHWLNAV